MLYKFIKKLSQRTQNIIGTILGMLIITSIAAVLICLVFSVIGKFGKLSFMTSLAGLCFSIFLIIAGVLAPVLIIILTSFVIDAIRRDGFKKLFIRFLMIFTVAFILIAVFYLIKYKSFEWTKSSLYSLVITLSLFFKAEVDIFIKEKDKE
ncbi:hypothetical protein JK636_19255 [Clostridium sp. YIM B02515]|uniref:Uncharacterized protein n=1 Tax=Clostridium rhizosphaerae TaxID=2803861 RepID=A0ABS1THN1_9CLOT|nr:hypothetical protein [Clostridium rhizosphaerae]MBL4937849.1 hypothetical protein [Clostridium rhizosphaerae]